MLARLAGASVTREHALVTCEPRCMPNAAKPFFIPMVHRVSWTRGSTGAPLDREAGSRAIGHIAALEPTSEVK
jgi:hypothetical protein